MQKEFDTPQDIVLLVTEQSARLQSESSGEALHLYALADAGADAASWRRLSALGKHSAPLLRATDLDACPHLIALGEASTAAPLLADRGVRTPTPSAYTLILSRAPFETLLDHLQHFCDVKLSGGIEMILALWDPAILGTLVGQRDDDTLHVPGPVFSPAQCNAFLAPVDAWWYCDRESRWHLIQPTGDEPPNPDLLTCPVPFDQEQEDVLVEAGVPDQVLYHLETNRPTLFDEKIPHARRYRFVRAVLPSARMLGLEGMRDLTGFVALCLIYRQRIETDPQILHLLDEVQKKTITFDEAMARMPE